ncbi:MAG TPA: SPOR domain-containing protein [Gemmatimonadaceae bacterium]|nr:SPOR domain-containing protein [Gemmatimonadaceae bacterium]
MVRWKLGFGVLLTCAAPNAIAQASARPIDPVFVRAQTLVSDGNGEAGRALIDSVIAATPPMAPLYPQALFWRATLASNAADAESDYKHIVVDYPLAPQAADALLRLAQLELARGDKDAALAHLQRVPRDYPRSKSLARASYWTARVLFEKNDIVNACAANASALAQTDTTEIELRNQIQYQGQRCPSTPATASIAAPTTTTLPTTASIPTPSAKSASEPRVLPSEVGTASGGNVSTRATVGVGRDSGKAEAESVRTQAARPKPPPQANDAKPSIVDPTKAPKAAGERSPAKSSAAAGSAAGYSVQVAAYNRKAEADKLVSTLKGRGYAARVDGSAAPFRVRIGRYASAKDAEDALKRIKAKRMDGFVVRAPER